MTEPASVYSVVAYNTAHASENKIHDNTVAQRFGFAGGLVPGVDVYAYMAHLPVARWGREFLAHGSLEARFLKPVYDGETATVTATEADGGLAIEVRSRDELCATGHAAMTRTPAPALAALEETAAVAERVPADEASLQVGRRLGIKPLVITAEWAARYIEDVRERDPLYLREGLSHPGQLPRLLNWALTHNVVLGDGGPRHQATVRALIAGGANHDLADRQGVRPLTLARQRGYAKIADMLAQAGSKDR